MIKALDNTKFARDSIYFKFQSANDCKLKVKAVFPNQDRKEKKDKQKAIAVRDNLDKDEPRTKSIRSKLSYEL